MKLSQLPFVTSTNTRLRASSFRHHSWQNITYNCNRGEMQFVNQRPDPKIVFIVPYRDRENHLNVFRVMMTHIMEDHEPGTYQIYFAHQADSRPFNRGAIKNVGFAAVRDRYPNTYRDMTFVFNDVDTVPARKGLLEYETKRGVIKHFYGVRFALGGIFSITGHDFEAINGFPCYWSWGYEDNVINNRVTKAGITIDRSTFFGIGDSNILQSVDTYIKSVNKNHKEEMRRDDGSDGVSTITDIRYEFERGVGESSSAIGSFIHIRWFETAHKLSEERISNYDFLKKRYVSSGIIPQVPTKPVGNTIANQQTNRAVTLSHRPSGSFLRNGGMLMTRR